MAEQTLPNTESRQVMAYAIAWEIVRRAHGTNEFYNNNAKDRVRILANEWIKAYQAIWSEQIIPDGE